MKPIIIGIAGGTSSGKTTIAKKVFEETKKYGTVAMIKIDDYYKLNNLSFEERAKINYDHPASYDVEYIVRNLVDLKEGKDVIKPTYDYVNHIRSEVTEEIKASNVIIVEGILTLAIKEIEEMCDIKLFVDTPDDIRFIRRIKRDIKERGRSVESVINQYLETVRPMHKTFVEPSKEKADLIIPEGGQNKIAIDFIVTKIVDVLKNMNE